MIIGHDDSSTTTDRHLAIVRISYDALANLLGLPEGARIVAVSPHIYFASNDLAVKIEHPSLPAVREGSHINEYFLIRSYHSDTRFETWLEDQGGHRLAVAAARKEGQTA